MTIEQAFEILAAFLSGRRPRPTFNLLLGALAVLVRSDWDRSLLENAPFSDAQGRHAYLISLFPEGGLECFDNDGGGGATAANEVGQTNEQFRAEILQTAREDAGRLFDARFLESLRKRFSQEFSEAAEVFSLASVDTAFFEVGYGHARSASVTARLMEGAGCAELIEALAMRIYMASFVSQFREEWYQIYARDLRTYNQVLQSCRAELAPRSLGPEDLEWERGIVGGRVEQGADTIEFHRAHVTVGGTRTHIYTGFSSRGDFSGRATAPPTYETAAMEQLATFNSERAARFEEELGGPMLALEREIGAALTALGTE